ncbi:MAG: hypothetical protein WC360_00010 [Opitutales bacterium]
MSACNTTTGDKAEPAKAALSSSKIDGFAVPAWKKGQFRLPEYVKCLANIRSLGANYISIHSTFYQDTSRGTVIYDDNLKGGSSPDIEEQRLGVQLAHKAGLKVILKPHVNLRTGEGWRGDIGKGMTPEDVDAWFVSYDALIVAHARMAQEEGVEMFGVGTELVTMDQYDSQWRNTVAKVREVYKGPVVYCANHEAENAITWWDAVDYIGIDAYYKVSDKENPTVEELIEGWKPWVDSLAALSKKEGKQVIFTELGYTPVLGTAIDPPSWELTGATDMQAQYNCYEAFFKAVYNQPWFDGVIFWAWRIVPTDHQNNLRDFTPEGKPAGDLARQWFTGEVTE